jgi:DNA-binding transcriptional LysR family regulator
MELSWLEDFLTLAETGNFNRAADLRHCSQPAFSRRIRALEDWAGTALFNRDTHRIALTPAGAQLRPFAEEAMRQITQGREEARAAERTAASTLKIAATHVLSVGFFPNWLYALERRQRLGAIRLVSESMQACEQIMQQGQAQFLLCHHHPAAPKSLDTRQFVSMRIGSDILVPVAAPGEAGAPRFALPGAPTEPLPYLAYSGESGLGRIVEAVRREEGRTCWLETAFTSHLAALLRRMAVGGRGLAWLPLSLVGGDIERGELVEAGADWRIAVDIRLFRPRARLNPAAEAFWALLESESP